MDEIWKEIPDLDGYFVSNLGRVKYLFDGKEKMLSPYKKHGKKKQNWYMFVKINNKNYRLHRLVLSSFTEKHPDLDVNHIDGNKGNNCLSNLEWCTRQQNVNHSYNNNFKNLSPRQPIKDTTTDRVYESIYAAFKELSIPRRSIYDVLSGKIHSTHGHSFIKISEYEFNENKTQHREGVNMQESFILKGYKNTHIIENDPNKVTELMVITREIESFPDDDEISTFMYQHNLDRCEIVKSYRR